MATAPDLDTFRTQFPELSEHADANVESSLRTARAFFTASSLGQLFLAAHILTAEPRPADSASAGGLNVKFAPTAKGTDRWFESTKYGQIFLQLKASLPSSLGITTMRTLENGNVNSGRVA